MPSKELDQPVHEYSLIRIFTRCILDSHVDKVSSCRQEDSAQIQAGLNLHA